MFGYDTCGDPISDGLAYAPRPPSDLLRVDDTTWLRRAHSVGHERQHLNLLTHALGANSLALWRRRHAQREPPLSLAA